LNPYFPADQVARRSREAIIRGVIWAFIGTLYGLLFVIFYGMAGYALPEVSPVLVAGTLSASIAALIYSSMRLASIVAPVASLVSIFTIIIHGQTIHLPSLVVVNALVGLMTGTVFGMLAKHSRVYRAHAKVVAGVIAGITVSIVFVLVHEVFAAFPLVLSIALMCLLTGATYVILAPRCVRLFDRFRPQVVNGAVVGCGTSVFVGLVLFVMVTGVAPEVSGSLDDVTRQIRELMPSAFLGGLLGGGLAGVASGWLIREWQDL